MDNYYGILMHRVAIDEGMYIFKPKCLIEGTLIEEDDYISFLDNNECAHLLAEDISSLECDEDTVVGYIITEEELQNRYDSYSLEDAKLCYLEEIFEHIHLGCVIFDENKIKIVPTDLQKYMAKMNDGDFDFDDFDLNDDNMDDEEKEIEIEINPECVFFTMERFNELLNLKDSDQLRSELTEIYNNSIAIFNDFKTMEESLKDKLNNAYESLLNIDNLNEMKETLEKLENMYIEFILQMDDKEKEGYDVTEARSLLYSISESYHKILKMDDLEKIKKEIKKIKNKEDKRIEKLEISVNSEIIENSEEQSNEIFNVKEIKKHFDERIIGQEEAKRDVISAIYMNKLLDDPTNKNNCLLVGPTGSGKTLIAETVADYFDMPIEIIDTTQLTVPGYVGANIEDFLERLLAKTKGDVKKAEEGIVVFDEIDKKGSKDNSDVSGKGVLNTLLPFIGGTTYDIKYNGRTIHFNTSKLTIFATGAFTDAASITDSKDYSGTRVGFNRTEENKNEDIKYKKFETDDFVKKGNIPAELIGRFSVISQLSGHTKESLRKILLESDKSALLSEKEKLSKINIELKWTDGYLDSVTNEAIKLKTGARSLKSTVDKSIKEVRWEVINNLELYSAIILTEKTVSDPFDCTLIDINGESVNLKDIVEQNEKTLVKK